MPIKEGARIQEQREAVIYKRQFQDGGLSPKTIQRFRKDMMAGYPLFTSGLSSSELLLTSQEYQPLSQVMGYSNGIVYFSEESHGDSIRGYQQYLEKTAKDTLLDKKAYVNDAYVDEADAFCLAHSSAAWSALDRLEQEATLLRAHGVIGARLVYHFSEDREEKEKRLLEYTATGTAIRFPKLPLGSAPFLSNLSGQEFWTLLQAGYYPAGIVMGHCSCYVLAGKRMARILQSRWGNSGYNQEIAPYSQALDIVRHLAMDRAATMARGRNALGIVGVHIDTEQELMKNKRTSYFDLLVQCTVIGTAITVAKKEHINIIPLPLHLPGWIEWGYSSAEKKEHILPSPKPTLTLTDLRPGRYGHNRALTFKE